MKKQIYLPVLLLVLSFFPYHLYSQTSEWLWQNPQPTGNTIRTFFINSSTGYGFGGGSVLKTTNAGENWVSLTLIPYTITNGYFINESTGWAAGYVNGNQGKILKTTNGGLNWVEQNTGLPLSSPLYCTAFIDENTGIVVGNGNNTVARTTNGGQNWQVNGLVIVLLSTQIQVLLEAMPAEFIKPLMQV
ncbi:MAG: hypothetical protein NTV87_12870 [Ignavibacteriae bacterium]|nr:hypothetical protein [Ignavibacteriota bacterium]